MARNLFKDPSIRQKNDASCIGPRRGQCRRAKRNSNKRDRQLLQKDLFMRWDRSAGEQTENPKVEAFLKEIADVCKRHGFSLSHEDEHGGFVVEKYNQDFADWLQDAAIGYSLKGANG